VGGPARGGSALIGANLGLRFLLELAAVAALVDWGMRASDSDGLRLLLGVGAGLAFVAAWAVLIAPRSTRSPFDQRTRMLVGSVLLLGAAVVAILGGRTVLGGVFAALVVVNAAVLWRTRREGMPVVERGGE
jgi:hypothetical protein